tara:strand:- start:1268 stop:1882 length:615 start_codon:yes stop_codon:yes gene_type:complete
MASFTVSQTSDAQFIGGTLILSNEKVLQVEAKQYLTNTATTFDAIATASELGITTLSKGTKKFNIKKSSLPGNGQGVYIFKVQVQGGRGASVDDISSRYAYLAVGHIIDCCLAEKLHTIIDCNDCNSSKCNDNLQDAQKMFLFKKASEYSISNIPQASGPTSANTIGLLEDAVNKYNKAVELCSSGCGCSGSSTSSTGSAASSY